MSEESTLFRGNRIAKLISLIHRARRGPQMARIGMVLSGGRGLGRRGSARRIFSDCGSQVADGEAIASGRHHQRVAPLSDRGEEVAAGLYGNRHQYRERADSLGYHREQRGRVRCGAHSAFQRDYLARGDAISARATLTAGRCGRASTLHRGCRSWRHLSRQRRSDRRCFSYMYMKHVFSAFRRMRILLPSIRGISGFGG